MTAFIKKKPRINIDMNNVPLSNSNILAILFEICAIQMFNILNIAYKVFLQCVKYLLLGLRMEE